MTSADDSNRSIITVLGRSERQVVEFGAQNLIKKKFSHGKKKATLPSVNTHREKKNQPPKEVRLTALTLSCKRNNTCVC